LALSLTHGTRLLSLVENVALGELAGQLIALASEQGVLFWRALGTIYLGWVKVKNGDVAVGISLLRSGSTAYHATVAEAWMPHCLALLARACEMAEQIQEGLNLSDQALRIVETTGVRWLAAELNRHKGQLLLQQGHPEAAEELYRKALSIAVEQEAKLWELRAAVSLARLRRDRVATPKPVTFLPPSTAGSRKASTRPISKRQRPCSRRLVGCKCKAWLVRKLWCLEFDRIGASSVGSWPELLGDNKLPTILRASTNASAPALP
jgi:tetratricopeptide (TPR) repeat protein